MNSDDSPSNPRVQLLSMLPKAAVCAEIGVWKGDFSQLILSRTQPSKLHLIDPWLFQPEFAKRMYGGSVAKSQQDMDDILEEVRSKVADSPNVVFNRQKSADALPDFEDDYFDWVYIDGNHYYDYVRADLNLCLRKVKPGGAITGDDYGWGKRYGFPIRKAVQEFVEANGLMDRLTIIRNQYHIQLT